MDSLFLIFFKYFWAIALILSIPNTFFMKRRFRRYIEVDPSLKEGYSRILRHFVFWSNLPWVVMGTCMFLGDIPYILFFFRPQDGDPYVLAWYFTIYALWVLTACWIFLRGGAEQLVKHPGFINIPFRSEIAVKALCILMLACGIVGVFMMYVMDIPIDQLPVLNETSQTSQSGSEGH